MTHSPEFCGSLPSITLSLLIGVPLSASGTECSLTTESWFPRVVMTSAIYDGITCITSSDSSIAEISSLSKPTVETSLKSIRLFSIK